MLQELAQLGMQMLRLAARHAMEEAPDQPPQPPEAKHPRRSPDPRLLFLRLASSLRETIALKARLAAGILPNAPRQRREAKQPPRPSPQPAKAPQDARRPVILRHFQNAIPQGTDPDDAAVTLRHVETYIDSELAKDPHARLRNRHIIASVCKLLKRQPAPTGAIPTGPP